VGAKKPDTLSALQTIVVPKSLQLKIVEWYHVTLCHPGETRTEQTSRQHFTWKGLRNTVQEVCKKYPTCQKTKRSTIKYGKLPPKEAEAIPWDKLCVDIIGLYTIEDDKNESSISMCYNDRSSYRLV
jgi:hypothetical protein